MSDQHERVRIHLVEDNPADAELCIRALRKHNLANELVWVKDGAEALDFLFLRQVPMPAARGKTC
jgi:CheY-like chemotaxis protein